MKQYWFSSDYHLGHKNIIQYDARPFKDIEEHDRSIIDKLKKLVKKGDDFYFLGDFALNLLPKQMEAYLEEISSIGASFFFIKGNHDHKATRKLYEKYGYYMGEQASVSVQGQHIVLNHFKMEDWSKKEQGSWHLHGHSHHFNSDPLDTLTLDMSINGPKYRYYPTEFEEIRNIMNNKVLFKRYQEKTET